MSIRTLALALVAGITAFLLVGVAVTEYTQQWIEFSLFVGIPAGIAAGAFSTAAVYFGLAEDAPGRRRRISGSFAAFGVGFLGSLFVLGWIVNVGTWIGILVSIAVAVGIAVLTYLRGSNGVADALGDNGDTPGNVS